MYLFHGEGDELVPYENSLIALPSLATNFQYHSPLLLKTNINFIMVVDGEQRLSVTNPLPVSGDFITNAKVIGCYDKGPGKGAVIEVETTRTSCIVWSGKFLSNQSL